MDIELANGQHRIVEARHVLGFLNRLHREHIPLDISSMDGKTQWHGLIRELDYHHGELLLMPLDPGARSGDFVAPGAYRVYGELSGVGVHFQIKLSSPDHLLDYEAYTCTYPHELYYHQRRRAARTRLAGSTIIPVTLHLRGYVSMRGRILDLSGTGLKACFYRLVPISGGELVPTCLLHLPGNRLFRSALKIKGISEDEGHQRLILRGSFSSVNRDNQHTLKAFLKQAQD